MIKILTMMSTYKTHTCSPAIIHNFFKSISLSLLQTCIKIWLTSDAKSSPPRPSNSRFACGVLKQQKYQDILKCSQIKFYLNSVTRIKVYNKGQPNINKIFKKSIGNVYYYCHRNHKLFMLWKLIWHHWKLNMLKINKQKFFLIANLVDSTGMYQNFKTDQQI